MQNCDAGHILILLDAINHSNQGTGKGRSLCTRFPQPLTTTQQIRSKKINIFRGNESTPFLEITQVGQVGKTFFVIPPPSIPNHPTNHPSDQGWENFCATNERKTTDGIRQATMSFMCSFFFSFFRFYLMIPSMKKEGEIARHIR